jgi:hypothetical protein
MNSILGNLEKEADAGEVIPNSNDGESNGEDDLKRQLKQHDISYMCVILDIVVMQTTRGHHGLMTLYSFREFLEYIFAYIEFEHVFTMNIHHLTRIHCCKVDSFLNSEWCSMYSSVRKHAYQIRVSFSLSWSKFTAFREKGGHTSTNTPFFLWIIGLGDHRERHVTTCSTVAT